MGMAELDPTRHTLIGSELWQNLKADLIDDCPLCGGSGRQHDELEWEDEIVPVGRSTFCVCKATALFRMKLHEAGLPREFWEADKIKPQFNRDQFAVVNGYIENITAARKHGLGVVLTGKNGAGKTTSGALIVLGAIRAGYTAAYINFPHLVDGWRRAWREPSLAKYLDERVCLDFVVLDEIGKEHLTNDETFVTGKLDGILRMRRGDLYPTVLISNLTTKEMVDRYGASMHSMLSDRFKALKYRPGDFRKGGDRPSWDDLLGGDADE